MNPNRKYKSKVFKQAYERITEMFAQEGDCFDSLVESVKEGYDSKELPSEIPMEIFLQIIQEATADYYMDKVEVLSEEAFLLKGLL
jgi:lipoate-protein ligase A